MKSVFSTFSLLVQPKSPSLHFLSDAKPKNVINSGGGETEKERERVENDYNDFKRRVKNVTRSQKETMEKLLNRKWGRILYKRNT